MRTTPVRKKVSKLSAQIIRNITRFPKSMTNSAKRTHLHKSHQHIMPKKRML